MKLKDQVAIVTGSSRGLGRETALEFARNGANVVVNYPDDSQSDNAREVVNLIKKMERDSFAAKADVTMVEQVEGMVKETIDRWKRIDILVNNAGIAPPFSFPDVAKEIWDKTLDVNITGLFNCTKAVIEHMKRQKSGRIINISSIATFQGRANIHYAASKAAVVGFTRSIARNFGPYGIRCNTISPGAHETPLMREVQKGRELYELKDDTYVKQVEEIFRSIPLGYVAKPISIAKAALFLASEEDSFYITGHNLVVDGGLTLR